MEKRNVLPPTLFYISIAIMVALHFLLPLMKVVPSPWNWLGLAPLACGVLLNIVADQAFHRAGTTVKPYQESTTLITEGVFEISRNPMYLGFVLILVGIAIFLRSLSPFLVVPVFSYLMDRIFITVEEQMLTEKFGMAWSDYKGRVRRWI
jgi:protein-S-isoprenylcysteine O-methyltransferase Ste14